MKHTGNIPIIKLYDTLIVSIQIELSDPVVSRLKDDITAEIERVRPFGLVVDLSGIDVMDSYITRTIRDVGLIAKLMGVRTVICGLDPMIALTLVEMGIQLEGVSTELNLEEALEALGRERRQDDGIPALNNR